MKTNKGGPAFPTTESEFGADGMSLRDYFAAQALVGILASLANSKGEIPNLEKSVAQSAYDYADAMLAVRSTDSE